MAISDPGTLFITTVLCAGLIASAAVHALGEYRRYRTPGEALDPFVSGRRLARRLLAAAVVCALMLAVFAGVNYGSGFLIEQRAFVRYWSGCLALIPLLLWLAFLDLRETRRVAHREMRLELERALSLVEPRKEEPDSSEPDPR